MADIGRHFSQSQRETFWTRRPSAWILSSQKPWDTGWMLFLATKVVVVMSIRYTVIAVRYTALTWVLTQNLTISAKNISAFIKNGHEASGFPVKAELQGRYFPFLYGPMLVPLGDINGSTMDIKQSCFKVTLLKWVNKIVILKYRSQETTQLFSECSKDGETFAFRPPFRISHSNSLAAFFNLYLGSFRSRQRQ